MAMFTLRFHFKTRPPSKYFGTFLYISMVVPAWIVMWRVLSGRVVWMEVISENASEDEDHFHFKTH